MTNKEFLDKHPLELSFPTKEAKAFEKCLHLAFRDNGIKWTMKKGIKVGNVQYYDFEIIGYTTSFARSFYEVGVMYAQKVLPIYQKRFKK